MFFIFFYVYDFYVFLILLRVSFLRFFIYFTCNIFTFINCFNHVIFMFYYVMVALEFSETNMSTYSKRTACNTTWSCPAIGPFDMRFDLHLFLQIVIAIGRNMSRGLH